MPIIQLLGQPLVVQKAARISRLELVTQKFEKIVENARNLKALGPLGMVRV